MRRALVLLLVTALTVAVVVVGVLVATGGDDEPSDDASSAPPSPAAPTSAPAVPLAELDTLTTAVAREAFCDRLPDDAVEAALGGPPTDTTAYADGQSAAVTGQVRDIAHEYSCGFTAAGATARAWVFAPPVTARAATRLARDARDEPGCRPAPDAPAFGEPSVALLCRTERMVQASYRGLFGDAWLTCTVAGRLTPAEALQRAGRWCVAVLAGTAP